MVTITLLLAAGATLTLLSLKLLRKHLPKRQNYTGHNIPTAAGLSLIPIILTTLTLAAGGWLSLEKGGLGYLAYSLVAGTIGFMDDVWGGGEVRGFRGHLGALSEGKVTTGTLKVFVLGGGALVLGFYLFGVGMVGLVAAMILAGSANLVNLFDVRPGRALKFGGVAVLVLLFIAPYGSLLAVMGVVGGAIVLFNFDVRGCIMLGDAGAAVFGTALGYLVVACGPGIVWWVAVAVILGLTALAEMRSISWLIEQVGVLRRFDLWGRNE